MSRPPKSMLVALLAVTASGAFAQGVEAPKPKSAALKSAVYSVRQTVTLKEIPADAKQIKAWIALPGDAEGQKLLDFSVVDLPGTWRMVTDPEFGNRFLYLETAPKGESMTFTVDVVVRRDALNMMVDPKKVGPITDAHRKMFARELDQNAPNMMVDAKVKKLADAACGDDTTVMGQARALFHAVADSADHYSKDATKPKCGRGSSEDCLTQGGGCCTDLHSLFIAAARSRGIPTRMMFGYRTLDKNINKEVDPGYRCWVEFFAPGYGWVPTDIVEGDALAKEARETWFGAMSEQRLHCCEGRNFKLEPAQASGPVNTMIIGHFEIDGKGVDPLPDAKGKPSPLTRKILFQKTEADPK